VRNVGYRFVVPSSTGTRPTVDVELPDETETADDPR
jgi:hypothetical protein